MSDMSETFKAMKAARKEVRAKYGVPCPSCKRKLPKANPKILLPHQKCWCGFRDKRPYIDCYKEVLSEQDS